jgi:hypothetical protein
MTHDTFTATWVLTQNRLFAENPIYSTLNSRMSYKGEAFQNDKR